MTKRRVISVWLPRLATDRLRRVKKNSSQDKLQGKKRPLVMVDDSDGRERITATNEAAAEAGIFQGMTLADAQFINPSLYTSPADPMADAFTLEQTVRWCGRYTPLTAVDGLDGIRLDTTGCAHLFGGEQAMLDDIIIRLEVRGFSVRAALADTLGAAWAFARYGMESTVVERDATRSALAFLPMTALRLDAGTVSELSRLGLRSVGDLYEIPRASLVTRFGNKLVLRLDQALGCVDEPIVNISEKPRYNVHSIFVEPIDQYEAIARELNLLIAQICNYLNRGGDGSRRLILTLYRTDGTLQQLQVGTSRPIRNTKHLIGLFAPHLNKIDPGFGIETMTLVASLTEPVPAVQPPFSAGFVQLSTSNSSEVLSRKPSLLKHDYKLGQFVDRLNNRFGLDAVMRLTSRESFLPERAEDRVPIFDKTMTCWNLAPLAPKRSTKPLRLFTLPEPIEIISERSSEGNVPPVRGKNLGKEGGAPMFFRWREIIHQVLVAEGPERIAPEWWRQNRNWQSQSRDYWRVENTDGRRFWLYCEVRAKPGDTLNWFLHGLFA